MLMIGFANSNVFASDNVLQAIQVNGVKDTYNIILKSDDVAELNKTIQAPNKMILTLKGIRASKTINTIYNNTSSVDSVVVEPIGDDSVKILVQATNVAQAGVHFDTLKTPLGVLGNETNAKKAADEIVLSGPTSSFRPVYNNSTNEEEAGSALGSVAKKGVKKLLKDEKISWALSLGLLFIFLMSGFKLIKGNDNEIKVGLTQSLKDREIELYRGLSANQDLAGAHLSNPIGNPACNIQRPVAQTNLSGASYGLKAYQDGNRNPYATPEVQRQRPAVAMPSVPNTVLQQANNINLRAQAPGLSKPNANVSNNLGQNVGLMQNTIQKQPMSDTKPKASNIDSMKFLESMTKIYEKNGRTDLAQGLKSNIKKAKMNMG